jgi:hypothetical protein
MDTEHMLGEIETYCRDLHWSGSPSGAEANTLPEGHCREQAPSTPSFMELELWLFSLLRIGFDAGKVVEWNTLSIC